jgi:hypothetical protein
LYRVGEDGSSVFDYEDFFFEISRPILENVRITIDDAFLNSQVQNMSH